MSTMSSFGQSWILRNRSKLNNVRHGLAGLIDSSGSSLATFVTSLFAVRTLSDHDLALYSLLLTGAVTCMVIPQQLVLGPIRMFINLSATSVRSSLVNDLFAAKWSLILIIIVIPLAGVPLLNSADSARYVILAIGAVLYGLTGSLQMHVRSTLHTLGWHGAAAWCSLITAVIASILVAYALYIGDLWPTWISPFVILGLSYTVSLLAWLPVLRRVPVCKGVVLEPFKSRVFYVGPQLTIQAIGYAALGLVAVLLGATAVAQLEGARVVSAPVFILASSLLSFLVPSAIRMLRSESLERFRARIGSIQLLVAVGGIAYGFLLFLAGNRLSEILHREILVCLAAVRSSSFGLVAASDTLNWSSMALRQSKLALAISLVAGSVTLVVLIPLTFIVGVFSLPLSEVAGSIVRLIGGRYLIRRSLSTSKDSLAETR